MKTVEFVVQIDRVGGERLSAAERLLRWYGQAFGEAIRGCDLAWCPRPPSVVAYFRFSAARFGPAAQQRLVFWSARAGARARLVGETSGAELAQVQELLDRCETRFIGLSGGSVDPGIYNLFTAAGADPGRTDGAVEPPPLAIDVKGPGWSAVRWIQDREALFIASPTAPPLGDLVPIVVRVGDGVRPASEKAAVVFVRGADEAGPGHPAGFALGFEGAPAELRRELARSAPVAEFGSRSAPRFRLKLPVRTVMEVSGAPGAAPDDAGGVEAFVGWVENLSMGGAFVRTEGRPPEGTAVHLRFRLPTGVVFDTRAFVAFADAHGVGVRFVLDRDGMRDLHDALTRLSARPRRALVVDDSALARQQIASALVDRGYEVVTAADAEEGLHLLAEELLSLDLLVTDLYLPGGSGEDLVATIRRAGGESDLVVAVMTGSPTPELASRLGRAGADLLVGKDLGAELVALKADALLDARFVGSRAPGG